MEAHLARIRAKHPDPLTENDALGADAVRDRLDEILSGRLGEPHDVDELIKVGRERYEREQPPGFEDSEKDEPERYGDLAIWLDMIDKARAEEKGVIFITDERKDDWWWKQGGETFAPRRELVDEMREKAHQQVYLYRLERFMDHAGEELEIELSEDERDDVVRAGDAAAAEWSPQHQSQVTVADPHPFFSQGASQPLASGFVASPAGGVTAYPTGSKPFTTKLHGFLPTWRQQWIPTVVEKGTEVALSLVWEPHIELYNINAKLICQVTPPTGEVVEAAAGTSDLRVAFTYPRDFSLNEEPQSGRHSFQWFCVAANAAPLQVASGSFELEVPDEAGDEDGT